MILIDKYCDNEILQKTSDNERLNLVFKLKKLFFRIPLNYEKDSHYFFVSSRPTVRSKR